MVFKRGQHLIGKALHTISRGDMAMPSAPEGQRVNDGFTQDDFLAGHTLRLKRGQVEHPAPARGVGRQVQVQRRAVAQSAGHFAAVQLGHLAVLIQHGHDQRAIEMLMARFAVHAQALQPRPDLRTFYPAFVGQTQTQRAVGKAKFEVLDQLGVIQPSALQVRQRLGRLL